MGLNEPITEYHPPKRYWARKAICPYLFPVDVVAETDSVLWIATGAKRERVVKSFYPTFETFEQARDALVEETKTLADRRLALLQGLTPEDCTP
jgi:hypothetical protein